MITDGLAYDLRVGQMVVFGLESSPKVNPEKFWAFHGVRFLVKRVAAVEGDIVDFENTRVRVPKGHFWALGDNASMSYDSRAFGPVPLSNLRAVLVGYVATSPFRFGGIAGTDAWHAVRSFFSVVPASFLSFCRTFRPLAGSK